MADPQIQLLEIAITGGESQNQDDRAGDGLLRVEDAVYRRRGGLQSRLGQDPLAPTVRPSGYNPTGSRREALIVRSGSLAIVEGSVVRPYADAILPDGEIGGVGLASAYYVAMDPLEGGTTEQTGLQIAVSGTGYMAAVWVERPAQTAALASVLCELFSEDGSTLIPAKVVVSNSNQVGCPQISYVAGIFLVTWIEGLSHEIKGATFAPTTGVIGAPVTLMATQNATSFGYRAAPHSDGTSLIIVGGTPNGADPISQASVRFFSAALAPLGAALALSQIGGGNPRSAVSFGIYTEAPARVWISVGYASNYTLGNPITNVGSAYLVNGAAPAAPAELWREDLYIEAQTTGASARAEFIWATSIIETAAAPAACEAAFSRLAHAASDPNTPTSDPSVVFWRAAQGDKGELSWAFGCILESDLWKHSSGRIFCEVIESTALAQPAIGPIPPLGSAHIVSTQQPATAANSSPVGGNRPCQVHATFALGQVTPPYDFEAYAWNVSKGPRKHSNQAQIARLASGEIATVCYSKFSGAAPPVPKLVRASEPTARSHAELQGIVLISGGTPALYDGQSSTEFGFQHTPTIDSITATGAGAIANGDYLYAAEYQWISGTGAIAHSLVAFSSLYTVAGGPSALSVRVRLPQLSHKPDRRESVSLGYSAVSVILYRTIAGSTGPYYRLTSINVSSAYLADYGVHAVDIDDNYPDTGGTRGPLATFPQLYTTGGVLQAFPAPSARLVVAWLGRYVLGGTDDDSILFSVEAVSGEVPYFSPALRAQPFEGGRVTGLAVLDDKLVVFKRSAIFVMQGQLPDQRGLNGTIPSPTTVATDAGCIDPYSIVVAPPGVFFRSERGIQLLDRGLNLSFIGEGVAIDVEGAGPIVAPLLVPAQTQVRYDAPIAGGGGAGPIAVYDYLQGAWARWLVDKTAQPQGRAPVASASLRGRPYWLDAAGTLWRERLAQYHDGDALRPLSYRWRSAWASPGGLQGYFKTQAVHVLGLWGFPHRLTIRVFVDYDEAAPACTTSFLVPASPPAGYEFRASITAARAARVQACAVEVEISWDGSSATAPGAVPAVLSGVALEILPIGGGQRRIPATQKG